MRSRFSAFALRDVAYLWKTLDPDHPDRQRPQAEVLRAIKVSSTNLHFMRLRILDRKDAGDGSEHARVLFLAEVFERGRDLSFFELSSFRHDGTGWRYLEGTTAQAAGVGAAAEGLTIEAFEKGAKRRRPR
jgi:SEC-C motif-containing protein